MIDDNSFYSYIHHPSFRIFNQLFLIFRDENIRDKKQQIDIKIKIKVGRIMFEFYQLNVEILLMLLKDI